MNHPDHNTLWRFYRENKLAIKKLLRKSVELAISMDLIGLALNAVDGAKIPADVSLEKAIHRETLNKLLSALNGSIEEYFDNVAKNEEREKGLEYKLPDKYSDNKRLRETIKEQLKMLDDAGTNHLNSSDTDSRMVKCSEGIRFGYNAQAVVDSRYGMVVAGDVVQDESDNHQLVDMLEEVEENVGEPPVEMVADAGYFSGEELAKAEQKGFSVLVNIPETEKDGHGRNPDWEYHQSHFRYDSGRDVYICPRDGVLTFRGEKRSKGKRYVSRVYRCADYRDCPFRFECSSQRAGRTLEVMPYGHEIRRQKEKQEVVENRELLSRRKCIVEPVFGNIKRVLGFRRWTVRGLDNVRVQWSLICLTVNLRKMYRIWLERGYA